MYATATKRWGLISTYLKPSEDSEDSTSRLEDEANKYDNEMAQGHCGSDSNENYIDEHLHATEAGLLPSVFN